MSRSDRPRVNHPYVFSVSQVETFDLCNRKWAFEKIDNIKGKENKYAALGGRVHSVLDKYLEKAIPIDVDTAEGRIAFPGIKHLPFPKMPGMRIEKWFAIKFGVAAYVGLLDVELVLPGKIPLVLDHKTTRSWTWKKTSEELKKDKQAGVYSAYLMAKTGSEYVDLKWVYYKTEGKPKSEVVENRLNREEVSKTLTRVNNTARKIIHVIQTCKKAMDVTPNYASCSAFGGCSFRESHCKPKPAQVLKAIITQKITESRRSSGSIDKFISDLESRKEENGKQGN